jgi:zinc-ribbon domain
MYCGTCGAALVAGARFCGQCGTPLPAAPPTPGAAGRSPVPVGLPARSYLPAQPVLAPAQRLSPFVAGLLECFVPGVGLLYAGSIVAGSLVLVFTLLVGGLLSLYGLGIAQNARPIALLSYFTCASFVLVIWLVARCVWAVRTARRSNAMASRAIAYPPTVVRSQPYAPPGPPQV